MAQATRPRLARRRDRRIVAGVAAGVGEHLGVDPNLVRLAFVVLCGAGGLGAALYLGGWILLPEASRRSLAQRPLGPRSRWDWGQAAALGAIVLGVLLLLGPSGVVVPGELLVPAVLTAAGIGLILGRGRPEAPEADARPGRPELVDALLGRGPGAPARAAGGVLLVAGGVGVFLATSGTLDTVRQGALAALVIAGGLALIFGPWLWRLAATLAAERRERIRSEERAEVAAHLHDSVLQTLAMIQRRADQPRVVTTLARRQERELRSWLFGAAPSAAADDLGDALERAAAEVEAGHGVPIDVVAVGGDCPLDDRLRALVLASREAMTNAAVHSGTPRVSVYIETEPERVCVFVRDGGAGFDRSAVTVGRGGLAESIEGRLQRAGGTASVRSRVGEGTEVELSIPRDGS